MRAVALLLALAASGVVSFAANGHSALRLASPFAHRMVLQRDRPVPVWGTAAAGERVTVSFAGQDKKATAGADGRWRIDLDPLSASKESRDLVVTSSGSNNRTILHDVLVGEVWFASGQSNMKFPLVWVDPRHCDEKGAMIAQYKRRPDIRFADYFRSGILEPTNGVRGVGIVWKKFLPENLRSDVGNPPRGYGFSAVASYFALELREELDVPIGIIASCNGGMNIEGWIPRAGYEAVPELKWVLEKYPVPEEKFTKELVRGAIDCGFRQPMLLWNSSVEPFAPFAFRGMIWYQGEQNVIDHANYPLFLRAFYAGWTKRFENPQMPFLFVQVCPWGDANVPAMQEAQASFAAAEPNASIVIANDLGNVHDIHPNRKQLVAQRLALQALKKVYGRTELKSDSPTVRGWRIEGDRFVISFRDVERFYVYNDDRSLDVGFEIAGADGVWKKAEIRNFTVYTNGRTGKVFRSDEIVGNELVVSADGVTEPKKLRFLHAAPWKGALFNEVNLPVGAFHLECGRPEAPCVFKEEEK